jgi:hypothetical protein
VKARVKVLLVGVWSVLSCGGQRLQGIRARAQVHIQGLSDIASCGGNEAEKGIILEGINRHVQPLLRRHDDIGGLDEVSIS